jgi:hypothetical protein
VAGGSISSLTKFQPRLKTCACIAQSSQSQASQSWGVTAPWSCAAAAAVDEIQGNPPKPHKTSLRDSTFSDLANCASTAPRRPLCWSRWPLGWRCCLPLRPAAVAGSSLVARNLQRVRIR